MKPHNSCLLITVLLLTACSQQQPKEPPTVELAQPPSQAKQLVTNTFSYVNETEIANWRTFEKSVRQEYRDSVANALESYFKEYETSYYPQLPITKDLHLLDLNGDQQLDVVYNGTVGAESDVLWLFVNEKGHYKSIFQQWGRAKEFYFQKGHLKSLAILDFGCCADYVELETTYTFNQQLNPHFALQRGTTSFTSRPTKASLTPARFFKLITDSVALRATPIIDDTSTVIYDGVGKGNILLKSSRGTEEIIWANKMDSLDQQWHYVEVLPSKALRRYLMYEKNNYPTRTLGWMRAADIK